MLGQITCHRPTEVTEQCFECFSEERWWWSPQDRQIQIALQPLCGDCMSSNFGDLSYSPKEKTNIFFYTKHKFIISEIAWAKLAPWKGRKSLVRRSSLISYSKKWGHLITCLEGDSRGQTEKLKGRIQINNNQTQSTNKSSGMTLSRKITDRSVFCRHLFNFVSDPKLIRRWVFKHALEGTKFKQ